MAFIGVFIVLVLFILILCLLGIFIIGLTLFIIGTVKAKKKRKFKIMKYIGLGLTIGSFAILLPCGIGIGSAIAKENTIPSGYVEKENVIIENNSFSTQDGKIFFDVTNSFNHNSDTFGKVYMDNPVYSYKPKDSFKSEWTNICYAKIDGFDFYIYNYHLYRGNDYVNNRFFLEEKDMDSFYDYIYDSNCDRFTNVRDGKIVTDSNVIRITKEAINSKKDDTPTSFNTESYLFFLYASTENKIFESYEINYVKWDDEIYCVVICQEEEEYCMKLIPEDATYISSYYNSLTQN